MKGTPSQVAVGVEEVFVTECVFVVVVLVICRGCRSDQVCTVCE